MIDFRYHLVSLMAVLIALTVGVILGAGPLQGPLSATLNGQLDQLKENQATSRAEIESLRSQLGYSDTVIKSVAQSVLPGSLEGVNVAIVTLPDAREEHVDAMAEYIKMAGGKVACEANLQLPFVNVAKSAYREEIAKRVPEQLVDRPVTAASAEQILFTGLIQILTTPGANSDTIKSYLTSAETPLVVLPESITPAQALVLVGGPTPTAPAQTDNQESDPAQEVSNDALLGLAKAMGISNIPTVIVGASQQNTDLVAVVRSEQISVNTIDNVGRTTADISVPLVLAQPAEKKAKYGFATSAEEPLPPLPKKAE